MNITLSPVGGRAPLTLSKAGDALTGNGQTVDFTDLLNGATLPRAAISCDWIAGDVTRDAAGVLTVPVILPHGLNAPEATRFPTPIEVLTDGEVALPPYDETKSEEAVV
ncbi:hypothetical protein [Salipiger sp. PrR007]|uniref:hypothetical protein n=1 Tax=Salipiger sp. PrR007 TaxID=2706884 RepID=UPI0013B861EF|nr:hypothetical protein [Salipiger sp. PrR007]NDW31887.1 hypothetical protein [Salipiger sp. PrR007]